MHGCTPLAILAAVAALALPASAQAWSRPDLHPITQPAPASSQLVLYVAQSGGVSVVALDAATGATTWSAAASTSYLTPGDAAHLTIAGSAVVYLARAGDAVTVELPDGESARGRVTDVGKVATQPAADDADPTIEVTIALRGRAGRGTGLDQAPVDVGFASERRRDVLAVPVTALLARSGGGFAVEAVDGDGRRRLVPVEPGMYADDRVEVSGDGVREGMRVVTAA